MNNNEKAKRLAQCIGDIDDEIVEEAQTAPSRRPVLIRIIAIAACLLFAAAVVIPVLGTARDKKTPVIVTEESVESVRTYDDIYAIIEDIQGDTDRGTAGINMTFGTVAEGPVMEEAAADFDSIEMPQNDAAKTAPALMADTASAAGDYSQTNVQVKGVDEGDIIKNDGEYIYRLYSRWGKGSVAIISADDLKLAGKLDAVSGEENNRNVQDMYVSGDRLALICNYTVYFDGEQEISSEEYMKRDSEFWEKYYSEKHEDYDDWQEGYTLHTESRTATDIFDITDRTAPKALASTAQSGYYTSSRLVGDKLYIVTNQNVYDAKPGSPRTFIPYTTNCDGECKLMPAGDICIFDEPDTPGYTVVGSIDIDTASEYDSIKAVFGCACNIYVNAGSMIAAANHWHEDTVEGTEEGKNVTTITSYIDTDIVLFALDDGKIEQKASGRIDGSLLNQFSMDEYGGYFRFVTTDRVSICKVYTDGMDTYEYQDKESNALYVLNSDLNIVGSIEDLAPNEQVYSVRFDGNTGYFVTFRQVDPLFTVDLTDPTAPKILSTLKIPGFSQYLHPYADGRLFGLGMDADENGRTNGMKLTMFDTSDPANVTEKHTLLLEEYWSEALNNHKAIVISRDKDIIAFPKEDGYVVYGYSDEQGFYKRAEFEFDSAGWYSEMRGLYIGEDFFVVDDACAEKYSMPDFAKTAQLEFADREETVFVMYD